MKIAICTPVHDTTKALFTGSLFALQSRCRDHALTWEMHHGNSRIEEARETLARNAMDAGADWLLWLDADQAFPPDTFERLLAHGLPFVGANYRKRRPDRVESAAQKGGRGIEPKREGLDPVDLIGFGVVLTSAEMFRKLPRPWFQSGPHGEDGHFCEQAIRAGFRPHVDHALSMEVGHIAETVLRFPA